MYRDVNGITTMKYQTDACLVVVLMLSTISTAQAKVCSIISVNCAHTESDCCQWPVSSQRLAQNCTQIQLSPGIYNMPENMIIKAVTNFSIVGNNSAFRCQNKSRFSLSIHNSHFVRISNIKFINCGYDVNTNSGLLSSPVNSVISLSNTSSVTITNVAFDNSCGYAVYVLNTFGKSLLQNISILHTKNIMFCDKARGGIFWLNYEVNGLSQSSELSLTITDCLISNALKRVDTRMHEWSYSSSIYFMFRYDCNSSKVVVSMFNINITNVTSVNESLVFISNSIANSSVTLSNSSFNNNTVASVFSVINSPNTVTSFTVNNVLFHSNVVYNKLFSVSHVNPTIEGNVYFVQNVGNVIMSLSDYIIMTKKSALVFYKNTYIPLERSVQRFIIYMERPNKLSRCPVQFTRNAQYSANITFCRNKRYDEELYADMFVHNCTWKAPLYSRKINESPVHVYNGVMHTCEDELKPFGFGRENMICQCDREEKACSNFTQDLVSPGQTTTVSMVHPKFNISVYTDFTDNRFARVAPTCELKYYNLTNPKVSLVLQKCTQVSFIIASNSTQQKQCLLILKTASKINFVTVIRIPITDCPIGFTLNTNDRICQCNPKLADALHGVTCRISDEKIKPPVLNWISAPPLGYNRSELSYVKYCKIFHCLIKPHFVSPINPDTQCLPGRTGLACGQCKNGLSTIFGSSKCKLCSNYGLFLIIFFAAAGILLIIVLFLLNLTVVNGDIYGFIVFVNALSTNSEKEFSTKYFLVDMFNLDLGIEACFYNGMTAYVATWLEFAFPLYLLSIVAGLVVASRYSVKIEKLTRQKVIPVIATLFLLTYNKIMIVTFNVLFSYSTVYHLYSEKTEAYWTIDTGIKLFGVWHLLLVLFCVTVLLFVIIPINALLIYPKPFYRFKIIVSHLRPFIDAYTAPLKDHCQYLLGFEFVLKAAVYMIRHVWSHHAVMVYMIITILYIAYLCRFQPFRCPLNNFIYSMYVFCLTLICILFMQYAFMKAHSSKEYMVIVAITVHVALAVFALIVAYHIWRFQLCNYRMFIKLEAKYKMLFGSKQTTDTTVTQRPANIYEEYQEELLAID